MQSICHSNDKAAQIAVEGRFPNMQELLSEEDVIFLAKGHAAVRDPHLVPAPVVNEILGWTAEQAELLDDHAGI